MVPRKKKLVGAGVLVVFLIVYALAVMALAPVILKDAGAATSLIFYALAGLAWVLPILPLISWMERR